MTYRQRLQLEADRPENRNSRGGSGPRPFRKRRILGGQTGSAHLESQLRFFNKQLQYAKVVDP